MQWRTASDSTPKPMSIYANPVAFRKPIGAKTVPPKAACTSTLVLRQKM